MTLAGITKAAPLEAGRWYRPAMFGLTVLLLIVAGAVWFVRYQAFASRGLVGIDLSLFTELGRRWAETGSQYAAFQFQPYRFDQGASGTDVSVMPGLYPPLAGPVFAVIRLAPVLWWIPVLALPVLIYRWHPAPWAWPLIALGLAMPHTSASIIVGGSVIWITLFLALGLRYRWPAALILLKPTLAPLALIGVRDRRWWMVLAIEGLVTLALVPELWRYLYVIGNAQGSSLLYSLEDVPLLAIPVVAWVARPGLRATSRKARAVPR